jgi:1-acyl-sn-glycerol-3-phosphate acyltransferase
MKPEYLYVLAVIYAISILRIGFFFIPPMDVSVFRKFNALIGRIEWAIHPFRDYPFALFILAVALLYLYSGKYLQAALLLPFVLLSIFASLRYLFFRRRVADFIRKNPLAHPKDLFEYYFSGYGFVPTKLPKSAKRLIVPTSCPFGAKAGLKRALWPVIAGVVDTAILGRLVIAASKWKGPAFSQEVADSLITTWGARMAWLARLSVKIIGAERIENLDGKLIFAMTHKSFLDFAVASIAFAAIHPIKRKRCRPRFLAARDHFLDNPIYYRLMGKAMRMIGTIFVDRKGPSPKTAAHDASAALATLDIDLAIFPQGTRAFANVDAEGHRLDSGYYTSGSKDRLKKHDGHLKRGTAFIAVDTAIALKRRERSAVHIVPIGIIGTGKAAPKRSLLPLLGTEITIKFHEPITITGEMMRDMEPESPEHLDIVTQVHETLDERLKDILDTHAWLEKRFFKDLRALLPAADYEHVAVAMKAWRGKDYLIYSLLDCIYATRPANWPTLLRELSYFLISDVPVGTFMHFKERIIEEMFE